MLYDILIVGDSLAGMSAECFLSDYISKIDKKLNIALVSDKFNYTTDHEGIEHIQDKVMFVRPSRDMVALDTASHTRYCAKFVIFATGAYSSKFLGDPVGVIHNERQITATSDNKQDIMILAKPTDDRVFDFVSSYKTLYNNFYICYPTSDEPSSMNQTLVDYSGTSIFTNAMPIALQPTAEGKLTVALNTYNVLEVDCLLAYTQRIADTHFIGRVLATNNLGQIVVSPDGRSVTAPMCYAVGECSNIPQTNVTEDYFVIVSICMGILGQLNV